jgi:hypothetical protein
MSILNLAYYRLFLKKSRRKRVKGRGEKEESRRKKVEGREWEEESRRANEVDTFVEQRQTLTRGEKKCAERGSIV